MVLMDLATPVPCYLDGGDKSSGDVRTETGRHGELGNIFFLLHCCGDALLAEELQVGNAVLHPHNIECRATGQEQTRVTVTPAKRGDGALQGNGDDTLDRGFVTFTTYWSTSFQKILHENELGKVSDCCATVIFKTFFAKV